MPTQAQTDPWGTWWVLLDTGWASGSPATLERRMQPLLPPTVLGEIEGVPCVVD